MTGAPSPSPTDPVLDLLRCPHCDHPFVAVPGGVRCPSGHGFDRARPGHLNLLGRAAPRHADTAAMVAARDRFLTAGHYAGIADATAEVAGTGLAAADPATAGRTLLEVGSGTGYHLARLLDALGGRGIGVDISAAAARRTARRHPRLGAVVADGWGRLPLAPGAFDLILSVFAPRNRAEFARLLRPAGVIVTVTPQPDHLIELREELQLLDVDPEKPERLRHRLAPDFEPAHTRDHRRHLVLGSDSVLDVVAMGPNAFHQEPAELARRVVCLGPRVEVTVAVTVSLFRRARPPAVPT